MQDLQQTALERLQGIKPGRLRAAAAAALAGGATGVFVYRLLRD